MDSTGHSSPLINFIEGNKASFPAERTLVDSVFLLTTGHPYTAKIPAELWLMVEPWENRILVPDALGALSMPFYNFDLNAADALDLQTIQGIEAEQAQRIIAHREEQGHFDKLQNIRDLEGLDDNSVDAILASRFDEDRWEGMEFPELSFNALLIAGLGHLGIKSLMYFVLCMVAIYLLFLRKEPISRTPKLAGVTCFSGYSSWSLH